MKDKLIFDQPVEYVVSQDIKDPDSYLDKLIADFPDDADIREKLELVKSLSHNGKVAWIFGLETTQEGDPGVKMSVPTGCIILVIVSIVAVVVGYEVVNGLKKALIEYQERQKEVLKCTEGKKPQ